MAERLARGGVAREFNAPHIHLGFHYESPLVVPEDIVVPEAPGTAAAGQPRRQSAAPGYRAPHAWLRPGVSTLDLFGRGFVLLCLAASKRQDGFARAFAERDVPLTVTDLRDRRIAELYERPFV